MAKETIFGTVHSWHDLNLIQQKVEISPATPKFNYVDIPGADGSLDLTDALGVGVKYADRQIKWTYALYPGENWYSKQSEVSTALNGIKTRIVISDEPDWYYEGRVSVVSYETNNLLRQITVAAQVKPYKKNTHETVLSISVNESYAALACRIGAQPLIPEITVAQASTVKWNGNTFTLNAGTHKLPELLMCGMQVVELKTVSGDGIATIRWREGVL